MIWLWFQIIIGPRSEKKLYENWFSHVYYFYMNIRVLFFVWTHKKKILSLSWCLKCFIIQRIVVQKLTDVFLFQKCEINPEQILHQSKIKSSRSHTQMKCTLRHTGMSHAKYRCVSHRRVRDVTPKKEKSRTHTHTHTYIPTESAMSYILVSLKLVLEKNQRKTNERVVTPSRVSHGTHMHKSCHAYSFQCNETVHWLQCNVATVSMKFTPIKRCREYNATALQLQCNSIAITMQQHCNNIATTQVHCNKTGTCNENIATTLQWDKCIASKRNTCNDITMKWVRDTCWSQEPPPPGGFPIEYVLSSRTVCKRTPFEEPGTNPSRGVLLHTVLDAGT